jgi:hypothetical protein
MYRRGMPGRAIASAVLASLAALPLTVRSLPAQREGGREPATGPLPTIEARTAGMKKLDGFFPLYWDSTSGHLYLEIAHFDTEVLHIQGMGTGLGSNDIGVERGNLQRSEIVFFEKQGPKVLLVKPNYDFRATFTKNADEIQSVKQSFARSVLWGFQAAAESPGRVLVDFTDFLLADPNTITQRLRPGSYRLDASRSSIYLPMTQNFPKNTEMEAELTWVRERPAGPPQGGIAPPRPGSFNPFPGPETFFEGVNDVAADPSAASLRIHQSLVQLPDAGYVPRQFDPRSGYGPIVWKDYSVPPDGDEMTFMQRLIRRHRLKKKDPRAAVSDPVQPIVYYVDPAVPEPQRSALMEGVGWWNQAFTAAGYRNAFQVKIRPDTISPLDVRYNVINWVHRSTRGYSSGVTVTDPRTGEILKGLVTLGSLRYRQDYLIAEALLLPYKNGTAVPPDMREWALARMRQLAAHESGHTLGFIHNYYDSKRGRISVMDYPAPLVTLKPDGSLDISKVYERGIGPWDSVAITWGDQDFPPGTDEPAALDRILNDAWDRDLLLLTNQDMDANPRADQWSNGWDPAAELSRLMEIRRVVLKRWGEASIRRGMPLAEMEEVLVPAYMYHGFQIVATASALGGMHYVYAMRGDGRDPAPPVPATEQRAALVALMATLKPSELVLPDEVIKQLPPRPDGFPRSRELFPRYTGLMFDKISPAVTVAGITAQNILTPDRDARIVEQHALDPGLPGLGEVVDSLLSAAFNAPVANPYEAEIARAVQSVVIDQLMQLAATASMPEVRAIATQRLMAKMNQLASARPADEATSAHVLLLTQDIKRFLDRPYATYVPSRPVEGVRGDPIGDTGMDFLRQYLPAPQCDWIDNGGLVPGSCQP